MFIFTSCEKLGQKLHLDAVGDGLFFTNSSGLSVAGTWAEVAAEAIVVSEVATVVEDYKRDVEAVLISLKQMIHV